MMPLVLKQPLGYCWLHWYAYVATETVTYNWEEAP
jgi:hypothetical protein